MKSIKINVSNNIVQIIEKPQRIVAGTVGLPVEFTFDSQWDGLVKTAVFSAGDTVLMVEDIESAATVPWEVLQKPGLWLMVGVYGEKADGTEAMPTIWANVSVIRPGAYPGCAPGLPSPAPVWQRLANEIGEIANLQTVTKENLVAAINELVLLMQELAEAKSTVAEITLRAANWEGEEYLHSQVVEIAGVNEFSQVNLTPSVEQLAIFREKDISFVAENEDGVVTVYVIGDRPTNDYTMQVTIMGVKA